MTEREAFMAIMAAFGSGLIGSIGTLLAKRTSSVSETQEVINQGFDSFMRESEHRTKRLEETHQECEARVKKLWAYIETLLAALRQAGISVPILSELPRQIEDRRAH